jgi:hypothetical protein
MIDIWLNEQGMKQLYYIAELSAEILICFVFFALKNIPAFLGVELLAL